MPILVPASKEELARYAGGKKETAKPKAKDPAKAKPKAASGTSTPSMSVKE